MRFTDLRLKFRRFLRKNGVVILIVFILWAIVFAINLIFKNMPEKIEPETTYEPHVSIMNAESDVPDVVSVNIEKMIEEYIGYCNEGNYQAAFNMLSEDCKEYEFYNDVKNFMTHVLTKMPTPKKYSIQDYSNMKIDGIQTYIYSIKYYDDYLSTGLTNSEYAYTTEKITFYREGSDLKMSAGNFIFHRDVKRISENEYLKIDVVDKKVNYSIEEYEVKFTNRSDFTVIVADGSEDSEVLLNLPQEVRERVDVDGKIILQPRESITAGFTFPKFVDDGDDSQALTFSNIRVLEKYSGPEAEESVLQEEINNAIAKMSMEVVL